MCWWQVLDVADDAVANIQKFSLTLTRQRHDVTKTTVAFSIMEAYMETAIILSGEDHLTAILMEFLNNFCGFSS